MRVQVDRCNIAWAQELVTTYHYLHRPVHPRACPFAYRVSVDGGAAGVIIMATPHFTRQRNLFGYDGLPTKWQTLVVARVWLDPVVQQPQSNGHASNVASCALAKMLRRVQADWLDHHPPRFPTEPHHIRLVLAYADTGVGHEGTIYRAANFESWGQTRNAKGRHSTRGDTTGTVKRLYVYRLSEPRWAWQPIQPRLIA